MGKSAGVSKKAEILHIYILKKKSVISNKSHIQLLYIIQTYKQTGMMTMNIICQVNICI